MALAGAWFLFVVTPTLSHAQDAAPPARSRDAPYTPRISAPAPDESAPLLDRPPISPGRQARVGSADSEERSPQRGLLGNLAGVREELEARGVQLGADYTFETASNLRGGLSGPYLRGAGQFAVRGVIDYERLLGVVGGTGAFIITQRHGRDVTADAALGTQTSVTEVFGRGRITRLTALWYEQQLGRWGSVKLGRMPTGEDFGAFSSEFQILALVGSQPGKIVGDYWYNWPVSQWGARLRVGSADTAYLQAGAFQVNPDNIENGFSFDFARGRGALLPVEAGWHPRIGAERLRGSYKLGGWYSTTSAEDVFVNNTGSPLALAGGSALRRNGQYGVYFVGVQELYRPDPGNKDRGLSAFVRGVAADRETTVFYRQITAGLVYQGLWAARPDDSLGVGVGQTSVNERIAEATRLSNAAGRTSDPVPTAERFLEVFYSAAITPNVVVRPNIQYIHRPSGVTLRPDVLVLGIKSTIAF